MHASNPHGIYTPTLERLIAAWEAFTADTTDVFARIEVVAASDYIRSEYGYDAYLWAVAQGQDILKGVNA